MLKYTFRSPKLIKTDHTYYLWYKHTDMDVMHNDLNRPIKVLNSNLIIEERETLPPEFPRPLKCEQSIFECVIYIYVYHEFIYIKQV